jgi:non-heme chloroperoxidase
MEHVEPADDAAAAPQRAVSRRAAMAFGAGATVAGAAALVPAAATADTATHHGTRHLATWVQVDDGVRVFVQDSNGGRRGTIVFVPGWPLSSQTLEQQLLFFADRGYRAIGLDLRGFGKSDAPYGPYGYDVWAKDILKVLEALSLRHVTLFGHSMGAAVALRHAARYGSRISRLVLAEPAAPRFVYGPHSTDLAAALAGLISGYATNRAAVVRALTANFFSTHTDIEHDPYLQWFERQCLDEASLPASRAGLIALRDEDLTSDLARVAVPTLVIHAINDKLLPLDHGQAVARGIRRARLVTFEKAGHAVYVDEPDRFNHTLLSFVS